MGLFNRKKKEQRNLDQKTADFIKGVDIDTGHLSNSGVDVDEETALKISAVYACVKVISETVASLPLNLLKELTNGDSEKAKQHPECVDRHTFGKRHLAAHDHMKHCEQY